ncbi:MAG: ATP-binding protein [Frankiales bacterium]|nr:ATP-binding protein [Frankiales bacterium]
MTGVWTRTPLRVKLVVALVLLATLGLAVSGVAATTALRGYLVDRVDQQLQSSVHDEGSISGLLSGYGGGRPRPGRPDAFGTVDVAYLPSTGGPFLRNPTTSDTPLPKLPTSGHGLLSPFTAHAVSGDTTWRVIEVSATYNGTDGTLYVSVPLDEVQHTVGRLRSLETFIGLGVLLLLALGGFLVVQRSLRPLVAVESAAEAIAEGDLTQRVPESDPRTEVGSLSASFNTMVARLESAFTEQAASEADARASEERMRRFVGDASHELRTPLTSIRGFAELYRSGALPPGADVDRAMSRIEGEASRMGLLVEDLLLLARLDQQRPLERVPVDLLELASDAVADAAAVDPARSVTLEAVAAGPPPVVSGDPGRLTQVLGNLVTNALTHTPEGTPVVVRVSTDPLHAVVEVSDAGPGISEEDRPRVFERFFRTDSSRTRTSGGTGLGLSIVAALVAAHGGTVAVDETPGGGATFRVSLPLA